MTTVRIDDPARMNILGLFLARALRGNLGEGGPTCPLRGGLCVVSEGMRATVVFDPEETRVTRAEERARVTLTAPLAVFVDALVRPRLRAFLRIKLRGNPLFALRAMKYLRP